MTLLEKALRNYRFQTYKNASYEGRAVGPPKLVKILDYSQYTHSGPYLGDPDKRPSNFKELRFLCCFQHPSGEAVEAHVSAGTIKSIPEYEEVVDNFKKTRK